MEHPVDWVAEQFQLNRFCTKPSNFSFKDITSCYFRMNLDSMPKPMKSQSRADSDNSSKGSEGENTTDSGQIVADNATLQADKNKAHHPHTGHDEAEYHNSLTKMLEAMTSKLLTWRNYFFSPSALC